MPFSSWACRLARFTKTHRFHKPRLAGGAVLESRKTSHHLRGILHLRTDLGSHDDAFLVVGFSPRPTYFSCLYFFSNPGKTLASIIA